MNFYPAVGWLSIFYRAERCESFTPMKSVPPRGSGWACLHRQLLISDFQLVSHDTANRHLAIGNRQSPGPTRYCEVVLTSLRFMAARCAVWGFMAIITVSYDDNIYDKQH